ncbi:chitin synthase [Phlyctochytrium arcticum]|nr:chitin synthase [Phlyctochytrium arcticum]
MRDEEMTSAATLPGDDHVEMGSIAQTPGSNGKVGSTPIPVAGTKEVLVDKPKRKMSGTRCRWLTCVWCSTFYVPGPFLKLCGRMKTKDRQIAWREKVALCLIILLMNAVILFFIIGLGFVLCPKRNELSSGEITTRNNLDGKATVHMYGSYYVVPNIWTQHYQNGWQSSNDGFWKATTLGQDVSQLFPKVTGADNHFAELCPGFSQPTTWQQFPADIVNPLFSNGAWFPHKYQTLIDKTPGLKKGTVVWDKTSILEKAKAFRTKYIVAYDRVYDVSSLFLGNYYDTIKINNGINFLGQYVSQIMDKFTADANLGSDATAAFETLRRNDTKAWTDTMVCMQGLFYAGNVDHRNDIQCQVPNYIMVVASCIVVSVIGFKFLAALQFGGKRQPEEHDKFVICQVPCYTEGEASLLRTLESLAMLDYDDKHKLLFVICDGMIIGSGNDRPTPRIVLDILGVDPSVDPEALAFESMGDGNKQLNMGKIYSGLYEIQGRVVPYIVVVKVGKPSERQRPGNRGKRDSQLILMRFLSRVHFNQAMNPLELELYHQMKNVIGVDPSFYEYAFMVDADTEVFPDSLNRLVSNMARDSKVAGICGETQISNERDSWVSMIQVYEYFISHHMAKAFESLFGSVTCLPGCFCMYRIRTPVKNVPLLVAPGVVRDYSENVVDTLHLKNLLHLGEDRYLTTLMLKHFPNMKTSFTPDAKCRTNAPDKWSVLLSQRRRWINSTVHNLLELLWLPEMCGFCCFSMRFVVFIDLFATFVQPAALVYIIYLIWSITSGRETQFPLISIILIAAIYGFQMVIFLLKREWQHIGWMIIYMLAMPIFGVYIPLYSFWHFDDFSWGNTRRVVEGDGQIVEKVVVEEPFDPNSIPMQKWSDFEADRMEKSELGSHSSHRSASESGRSRAPYAGSVYGGSVYGGGSQYGGTQYGANMPIPPYHMSHPPSEYGGMSYPVDNRMSFAGAYPPDHRMSYGMQQYPSPNDPLAPFQHSPPPPTRRPSQRSAYTVTSAAGPRSLPSDDEILRQVRHILASADLMSVTKKSVRDELGEYFGCDISAKREWIHRCIDGVLRGEL